MDCPKCAGALGEVAFEEVRVDRCASCGGVWFEAGEYARLSEREGSEDLDTGDPRVGRRFDAMGHVDCPRCAVPMIRMVDARQPHIRYESCKVCYGVFFDAGEFKDSKRRTLVDIVRDWVAGQRS